MEFREYVKEGGLTVAQRFKKTTLRGKDTLDVCVGGGGFCSVEKGRESWSSFLSQGHGAGESTAVWSFPDVPGVGDRDRGGSIRWQTPSCLWMSLQCECPSVAPWGASRRTCLGLRALRFGSEFGVGLSEERVPRLCQKPSGDLGFGVTGP